MFRLSIFALLLVLILAGCDSSSDDPAKVIMQYLEARIASDVDALRELSCAAWESQAIREADSFRGRNAELQGVTCAVASQDGDEAVIECEGHIVATYQGEQNTFPVGNYRVVQEDGAWKMCGESE